MPQEIIPLAVRIALRNAVGGSGPYTVRQIQDLFRSHGFLELDENVEDSGGVRRTTSDKYHARIDFTSEDAARRYLDIVDEVLDDYPEDATDGGPQGRKLRRALDIAGITRGSTGRLGLTGERPRAVSKILLAAFGRPTGYACS